MKALVILPVARPAVAALGRRCPLALTPCLGQPLLHRFLTCLAEAGAREVTILAADRPSEVRESVGGGESWGLRLEVRPEPRELSVAEARDKYGVREDGSWLPAPLDVVVLDRLPSEAAPPLWESYEGWFAALERWLPQAALARVGMRQIRPGVWVGLRSRVAPSAQFTGPVWIGAQVWVGPNASVGPRAVIEDGAYVDEGATVADSVVGPETYVGALTEVRNSLAWGSELLNLKNGSLVVVPDAFLLSEARVQSASPGSSWLGRLGALLTLLLSSPLVLLGWVRHRGGGEVLFPSREAVRGGALAAGGRSATFRYRELAGLGGWLRRWPQLWNVVRGEMSWVGNRPLTPEQAERLATDFDRLWLAAPTGLFCLADVMGCKDPYDEEGRAHASFFAVDPHPRKEARLLWRVFKAACGRSGG